MVERAKAGSGRRLTPTIEGTNESHVGIMVNEEIIIGLTGMLAVVRGGGWKGYLERL